MELSEMVEFARNFAVMIKITGPDPKGLKMRNHAFHQYISGKTTLSASGLLLPRNVQKDMNFESCEKGAVVVTVASIVEPFLSQKSKMIDAQVDVPASSSAVRSLIEASSGSSEQCWEVGWSLSARVDSSQKLMASEIQAKSKDGLKDVNLISKAATRIAFLLLPSLCEDVPEVKMANTNKRGDFVLSMGSPFGILSPLHFFNSISVGSVANCYPSASSNKSLLMADIRCLPGMEGSPIFGQHACLVGILNRPLRQSGGAEIQVVIPWTAIKGAMIDLFQSNYPGKGIQYVGNCSDVTTADSNSLKCQILPEFINRHPVSCSSAPLVVQQSMASVCLITLDNGVWASGVLLNKEGLILTNAHLLEPWKYGKTAIQRGRSKTSMKNIFTMLEDSVPQRFEQSSQVMQPNALEPLDYLSKNRGFQPVHQVTSQISVRVDIDKSWLWCDAKVVYVSKGPLDISLLQLESVPHQLCPINVDLSCPSLGSKAYVIGHGLLGPRCDLSPSISSGVVAKVVKSKLDVSHQLDLHKGGEVPVMLETTASVHPGSSGGAVVNSAGHMIALVTSNAKHGGGTVIPHMNFSIPSGALEPLFIFAKDVRDVTLLQQLDRPNLELASVWAMMPKISPEPEPLFRGKGSQFAKFMHEQQELPWKSRQRNPTENLTRDTIPSKL
ncbi:glyoxysomal processing protease, glyoxysomal isoform X2 [Silene latifolia]|uniref:glyoxysomal processing protease, glyoxysomal isoform X2 n=1 Tax=Silene latifolia TaxID=37657 RepID=UPI003D776B4E